MPCNKPIGKTRYSGWRSPGFERISGWSFQQNVEFSWPCPKHAFPGPDVVFVRPKRFRNAEQRLGRAPGAKIIRVVRISLEWAVHLPDIISRVANRKTQSSCDRTRLRDSRASDRPSLRTADPVPWIGQFME